MIKHIWFVRDRDFVSRKVWEHVQHFIDLGLIRSMQFACESDEGSVSVRVSRFFHIWNCYRLHLRRLHSGKKWKWFLEFEQKKYRQNDENVSSIAQHLSWVSRLFPFMRCTLCTNPMNCIVYDSSKNYRRIIPCAATQIHFYLYVHLGRTLSFPHKSDSHTKSRERKLCTYGMIRAGASEWTKQQKTKKQRKKKKDRQQKKKWNENKHKVQFIIRRAWYSFFDTFFDDRQATRHTVRTVHTIWGLFKPFYIVTVSVVVAVMMTMCRRGRRRYRHRNSTELSRQYVESNEWREWEREEKNQ